MGGGGSREGDTNGGEYVEGCNDCGEDGADGGLGGGGVASNTVLGMGAEGDDAELKGACGGKVGCGEGGNGGRRCGCMGGRGLELEAEVGRCGDGGGSVGGSTKAQPTSAGAAEVPSVTQAVAASLAK